MAAGVAIGSAVGVVIGSAVGPAVGAAAVDVTLEAGEDATGGGELCDFPHPPPTTIMESKQRTTAVSRQPARLPKSKIMFTGIYKDCINIPQLQP